MNYEIINDDGSVRGNDQQSFKIQIRALNLPDLTTNIKIYNSFSIAKKGEVYCISEATHVCFISQVIYDKRKTL